MIQGGLDDTICAIATPAGEGGIGIVRLSGPQALVVASHIVRLRSGQPLSSVPSHTLHLADLLIPTSKGKKAGMVHTGASVPGLLDEALVVHMKAPRSFTSEAVVEFPA